MSQQMANELGWSVQTKEKRRETALASGIGQRPDLGHADKGQIKDKEGADVPADDQLQWGVQTKEKEVGSFRQRKRGGKVRQRKKAGNCISLRDWTKT